MATSISVTGKYHADLKSARALGIVTGISPKAEALYDAIDNYIAKTMCPFQRDREIELLDQLLTACDNNDTESDTGRSLLPKPVLKRDRVQKPKPILKSDRKIAIAPNPLKRPTVKPVLKQNRVAGPKPKLNNKFNRSLFQ